MISLFITSNAEIIGSDRNTSVKRVRFPFRCMAFFFCIPPGPQFKPSPWIFSQRAGPSVLNSPPHFDSPPDTSPHRVEGGLRQLLDAKTFSVSKCALTLASPATIAHAGGEYRAQLVKTIRGVRTDGQHASPTGKVHNPMFSHESQVMGTTSLVERTDLDRLI